MPVLPSGRRVEFSLDRFHALLGQMPLNNAMHVAEALQSPDDLLLVLDAVHFSLEDGSPFYANYMAADWEAYAAEWNLSDRTALRSWFNSASARYYRSEAIDGIKSLLMEMATDEKPQLLAA
jgi:hypothetical protein